jgi:hypothetical protein
MNFDFGYKLDFKLDGGNEWDTKVDGCMSTTQNMTFHELETTPFWPETHCDTDINRGTYTLDCRVENGVYMVDIQTSVDVAVFIKGYTIGTLYNLTAAFDHERLAPGDGTPIEYVEFCFYCETPSPTTGPTLTPTPEPTLAPTPEPTQTPTIGPTEAPTSSPVTEEPSEHTSLPSGPPTSKPTEQMPTEPVEGQHRYRALRKRSIPSISDCNLVVSSGSALYGRPFHDAQLPPGIKSVTKGKHDIASDLQGFLLEMTGPGTFELSLYADIPSGIFKVGAAQIEVGSCNGDPNTKSSSIEWKAKGDETICVSRNTTVNKVHVSNHVPRGYIDFSPNCCEPGQPCYVYVESSIRTVSCGPCIS